MFLFLFCSFPFSSLLFCLKNVFLRVEAKKMLLTMSCSKVKANVAFSRCLGVITSSTVGIFGITNCTVCFRSSNAEKKEIHSSRSRKRILCRRWNPNSLLTSRLRTRDNTTTTTTTTREAHETATAAKQKQTVVRPSVCFPWTFHTSIPQHSNMNDVMHEKNSVILSSQIDANLPR